MRLRKCRDPEIVSKVTEGHRNRRVSIHYLWLPIYVP